jgi:hypothetical protein
MGRISFQKRQKEMKRQEKQQMKAERRAQRKLTKTEGGPSGPEMGEALVPEAIDPELSAALGLEPQP